MEAYLKRAGFGVLLVIGLILVLSGCSREVAEPLSIGKRVEKDFIVSGERVSEIMDPYHPVNTTTILDDRFLVPFLTVRQDGLIHPEAEVTKEDLLDCLMNWLDGGNELDQAISRVEAAIEMDSQEDTIGISAEVLKAALSELPEAESLDEVLGHLEITDLAQSLDRKTFAEIVVDTFHINDYMVHFAPMENLPFDLDVEQEAMILATQSYTVDIPQNTRGGV